MVRITSRFGHKFLLRSFIRRYATRDIAGMGSDGQDIVGFSDAAHVYFHKEFSQVTRDEFVSLVAMLVGHNVFNVRQQPNKNRERVERINRLLNGQCQPNGFPDVYYEACK